MTACECAIQERLPVIYIADYSRPSSKDVRDYEAEIIAPRRELTATKAELFRIRNQRR